LTSSNLVSAHPGEKFSAEEFAKHIAARDLAAEHSKRLTEKCATNPTHMMLRARAAGRRAAMAQILREERGIVDSKMLQGNSKVKTNTSGNRAHHLSQRPGRCRELDEQVP
jgi:hypothetical protein